MKQHVYVPLEELLVLNIHPIMKIFFFSPLQVWIASKTKKIIVIYLFIFCLVLADDVEYIFGIGGFLYPSPAKFSIEFL
jgi:hypothetical protein